jgi:hypothetical protein
MISNSQETILLCDHTKFGSFAFMHVAPLEKFDLVITGRELEERMYLSCAKRALRWSLLKIRETGDHTQCPYFLFLVFYWIADALFVHIWDCTLSIALEQRADRPAQQSLYLVTVVSASPSAIFQIDPGVRSAPLHCVTSPSSS